MNGKAEKLATWRGMKGRSLPTKIEAIQRGMLFIDQEDDTIRDRSSIAIRQADGSYALAELAYLADVDLGSLLDSFWFEEASGTYQPRFASTLQTTQKSQVKNVGAATFAGVGAATGATLAGTAADDPATDGDFVSLLTGAVSGNVASFVNPTTMNMRYQWAPTVSVVGKAPASYTSVRFWCGMFTSTPSGSDDPAITGFGVRASTGAGDTNYQLWRNDGAGGGLLADSGVPVVGGNVFGFILRVRPDNEDLELWVRGSSQPFDYNLAVTMPAASGNLPTSASLLGNVSITTLAAATKIFRVSRWTQYQER